jgi:hypothetical protein
MKVTRITASILGIGILNASFAQPVIPIEIFNNTRQEKDTALHVTSFKHNKELPVGYEY